VLDSDQNLNRFSTINVSPEEVEKAPDREPVFAALPPGTGLGLMDPDPEHEDKLIVEIGFVGQHNSLLHGMSPYQGAGNTWAME
jgi:hypothetical protein